MIDIQHSNNKTFIYMFIHSTKHVSDVATIYSIIDGIKISKRWVALKRRIFILFTSGILERKTTLQFIGSLKDKSSVYTLN